MAAAVFALSVLLVLLQLSTSFFWPDALWGVHHWAFFSPWLRLVVGLFLITALTLVFARGEKLCIPWQWAGSKWITYGAVPLLSLSLFWSFRIRHLLSGDAHLISVMGPTKLEFVLGDKNYLRAVSFLYLGIDDLFPELDWTTSLVLISCTCGGAYVLLASYLANRLGDLRSTKLFAFVSLVSTGAIQLFFGYVEEYVAMSLFAAISLGCLIGWEGKRFGWLVCACIAALSAFFLHSVALFALLPVAYAGAWQLSGRLIDTRVGKVAAVIGTLLLASTVAYLFYLKSERIVQSVVALRGGYHLFSVHHLTDVLNTALLLVPLHGILCGLILWTTVGKRWWRDPVLGCLLIGTIAAFATTFLINPLLGSLDWDLLSLYAFPCGALTAYLVCRYASGEKIKVVTLCFSIGVVAHTAPWIAANADEQRGVAMVESMVERDFHHCGERNAILGARLSSMGFTAAAEHQYRKGVDCGRDPMALMNLGFTYYTRSGHLDEALDLFDSFLENAPPEADRRLVLSILAFHRGTFPESVELCAAYILDHPRYERALQLGRAFREKTDGERDQLMIESALLYAEGNLSEAIEQCTLLAKKYGSEEEVVAFAKALYKKFRP